MLEYLVTDVRTLAETWVEAPSARAALLLHENAWRATPLPSTARASDYGQGSVIDVSLGESSIRGRRESVTRGTAT